MKYSKDEYIQLQKRHRKNERIQRFLRHSWLAWILDPTPYETHMILPRPIAEKNRRSRIRHTYSWHNIARLQNDKAFKSGLSGIVVAPVLAGLYINQPFFTDFSFPVQLAFIFASGLLYVLGSALYILRAPFFVKEFLEGTKHRDYRAFSKQMMHSAIQMEFLELGSVVEITAENFHKTRLMKGENELITAAYLMGSDGACRAGFQPVALGHVERLLYLLSEKHGFKIFKEFKNTDGKSTIHLGSGPGDIYSGSQLLIQQVTIKSASDPYLDHSLQSSNDEYKIFVQNKSNLLVEYIDSPIQDLGSSRPNNEIEPYIKGLDNLMKDEFRDTLVEELANWQSWQKPFSRLLALWSFRASLALFLLFIFFQSWVVIEAVMSRPAG